MTEFGDHNLRAAMTRTLIESCNRCGLGKDANRVPFGGVTWKPKLILLGEAPGSRENLLREPFVGPAGMLLDKILAMLGLTRNHVMIANTVCCRPPSNRDPEWSELQACKLNRNAQIRLGRTWVGVSLGRIALSTLLEDPGKSIGDYKGRPFWKDDMIWVPTYHPAYALRNKRAVAEIASHIKVALDIYEGRRDTPAPAKRKRQYDMEGGCIIVDHEGVKVPPKEVEMVGGAVFTKEEWARMRYDSSGLREKVILAKRELGAEVVS